LAAAVIVAALIVLITTIDYVTGPELELSILYFIPITYAAWALGRKAAIATAILAEIPTYGDELYMLRTSHASTVAAVSTGAVRLLVYLFVAEVTFRLVRSVRQARRAAKELRKLNEELQSTYARLDEDVAAAGVLQSGVLSFSPPVVPGCDVGVKVRYAGRTGGDFADAGTVDGRLYVCIADISGHGTPAALFTTLLKHLLSEAHRLKLHGAAVVESVNGALCRTLPEDRFVTLFYAEIDTGNGLVEYVNAGHPEGLIYRSEAGEMETAGTTTTVLGVCQTTQAIVSKSLRLGPRDVLTLYTDEAIEAKTADGGRIGEEYLRKLAEEHAGLGAHDMADRICADLEAAAAGAPQDDLTILCVKMS
jgi:serine phosphatase RsbU (regulator of sigma subunit)